MTYRRHRIAREKHRRPRPSRRPPGSGKGRREPSCAGLITGAVCSLRRCVAPHSLRMLFEQPRYFMLLEVQHRGAAELVRMLSPWVCSPTIAPNTLVKLSRGTPVPFTSPDIRQLGRPYPGIVADAVLLQLTHGQFETALMPTETASGELRCAAVLMTAPARDRCGCSQGAASLPDRTPPQSWQSPTPSSYP
jgi:hypothetical protein